MTELQGWWLLSMLAFVVGAILRHGKHYTDGAMFGALGIGFMLVVLARFALGL
ncbi:hypothetical protein LCGC14_2034360 [marine sediment metagenome]|uniref:Uncharacterized protein n=1 Tax=marine sediment metagenome TaxID=412755 RepID=A0A0F9FGA4_9ZZZZ